MAVTLDRVAQVFGVHPRTILRALAGDHNTYWNEDDRESLVALPVALDALAATYGTTVQTLTACIEDRDALLRPDEAAELLGIKPRSFRDRLRTASGPLGKLTQGRVSHGGIVRYLRSKVIEDKLSRMNVE